MPAPRRFWERILNFGVPATLYDGAREVAEDQHLSLAAMARVALTEYVRQHRERRVEGRQGPNRRAEAKRSKR